MKFWKRLDDPDLLGIWQYKLQYYKVKAVLKILRDEFAERGYARAPTPNSIVAALKQIADSRDDDLHPTRGGGDNPELHRIANFYRRTMPEWKGRSDHEIGQAIDRDARLRVIQTREEHPKLNRPPWYESLLRRWPSSEPGQTTGALVHIYTGEMWTYDIYADWHQRAHGRPPDWSDPRMIGPDGEMLKEKIQHGFKPVAALTKIFEQKEETTELVSPAARKELDQGPPTMPEATRKAIEKGPTPIVSDR